MEGLVEKSIEAFVGRFVATAAGEVTCSADSGNLYANSRCHDLARTMAHEVECISDRVAALMVHRQCIDDRSMALFSALPSLTHLPLR
jgi:hypothetical protein